MGLQHSERAARSWLQGYQHLGHLPQVSETHGVNWRVQFGPTHVPSVKLVWGLALDSSHQYLPLTGIRAALEF